jgi:hypothetical protein
MLVTRNTTARTTPDPGQGGAAVTGDTNTGHASTTALQNGAGTTTKTCMWQGFAAAPGGQKSAIVLKVDWEQNGNLSDGGVSTVNQFTIDYSLNGGGSWNSLRNVSQVQSSSSGTSQVSLGLGQDLTQVRVRDALIASGVLGEQAGITVTISNIRIEITTVEDAAICCGMM